MTFLWYALHKNKFLNARIKKLTFTKPGFINIQHSTMTTDSLIDSEMLKTKSIATTLQKLAQSTRVRSEYSYFLFFLLSCTLNHKKYVNNSIYTIRRLHLLNQEVLLTLRFPVNLPVRNTLPISPRFLQTQRRPLTLAFDSCKVIFFLHCLHILKWY